MLRTTTFLLTLALVGVPSFALAALDDNLLLLSPEFTQTGTGTWQDGTWEDVSGNGFHGANNLESFDATSVFGASRSTAVDAGASSSTLELLLMNGDNSVFNPGTDDYSLSFWYYQTDTTNAFQHVVSLGNQFSQEPGFSLHLNGGSPNLRMQTAGGNDSTRKYLSSGVGDISATGSHHVVAVFDRTGYEGVSLYVDNQQVASMTLDSTYDLTVAAGAQIAFGGSAATTGNDFSGYLDDIAIYQGALSSTDVSTLYTASGLDASTITTPGITPITIHNFETNFRQAGDGGIAAALDATGSYQMTPVGDMLFVVNDAQRGDVVRLPGVDDNYINVGDPGPTNDDLDVGTGSHTVSFWVNADDLSGIQTIAQKGNQWSSAVGWNVFMENGRICARIASTAGGRYQQSTPLTSDEWHHFAMVIDNENGLLSAYLDGQSSEATTGNVWSVGWNGKSFPANSDFSTAEALVIGESVESWGPTNNPFGGMIDDFATWDRALTEAEILDIYTGATIPVPEPSTLALLLAATASLLTIHRRK